MSTLHRLRQFARAARPAITDAELDLAMPLLEPAFAPFLSLLPDGWQPEDAPEMLAEMREVLAC